MRRSGRRIRALKLVQRAIALQRRAKDALAGPALEENLALIQTIFGDNSRAISTLTQLLGSALWGAGFFALRHAYYAVPS